MKFIFVGGCPRSGTTLVQKVLNGHSLIYGGPEFDYIPKIMQLYLNMKKGIENGRQRMFYDEEYLKLQYRKFIISLLEKKVEKESSEILSEKTPDNLLAFNTLMELFPEAKYVIVVRDPRAVLNSYRKVNKRAKRHNVKNSSKFGTNIVSDLKNISNYLIMGDTFYKKKLTNCHILYYEDLVRFPKRTVMDICSFLKIDFETEMLDVERKDDISNLLDLKNKIELPFNSELFSEKIKTTEVDAWKKDLSQLQIGLANFYFEKLSLHTLERYSFEKSNFFRKFFFVLLLLLYRIFIEISLLKDKIYNNARKIHA